ncbi:carbohydrate esterase family 3 protein [Zasmidium cellare ATCC 36951]|uniref:Carbohydrate esterase family 3 protein n=1 Tax=Zasmidium cellare ATCC 36951 TaxID=1080233 RepID=A0A6A6CJS0_ZASCE|nr:carbohydrate esterase family 3 protein [Zasmidium cellare ATCC 36951]KAF2167405.1 carbohydrate esterase family 3 protein [Zasmidium cellare ATCC 36951]
MRIMPVGDSLTEGTGSSDYNGYRLFLYNLHPTLRHFTTDNQFGLSETEGYSGYSLDHFLAHSREGLQTTLARNPNVVLLHIGTNDMSPLRLPTAPPPATAPERLNDLIDIIFAAQPNVVLLVAQIVHSPNAGWTEHSPAYNAAIPRLVARKQRQGYEILTVDMRSVGADCVRNLDGTSVVCDDLIDDGVHPKDEGYRKMAALWYDALRNATNRGYFVP